MIRRQSELHGAPPKQAAFDGGFASHANASEAKALGVRDAVFHKRRGTPVEEMARSEWLRRSLRRFRAGVEGVLSYLLRCFGLGRCTWSGFPHFTTYVWGSIVSANLRLSTDPEAWRRISRVCHA